MPDIDFRVPKFSQIVLITGTPQKIYFPDNLITIVHLNRTTNFTSASAAGDDVVAQADSENIALDRTAGSNKFILLPGSSLEFSGTDIPHANATGIINVRSVSLKAMAGDAWIQIVRGLFIPKQK